MPVTPISDYFYGASTQDVLQRAWYPSSGNYPVDTTSGIIHVAQDSGIVSGTPYVAGQYIVYESGTWQVFSSLGESIKYVEKGAANGVATLDGTGKVPSSQLPSTVMEYHGTYDASTNTPVLVDGGTHDGTPASPGDTFLVTVAGPGVNSLNFNVGDYAIFTGSVWEKSGSAMFDPAQNQTITGTWSFSNAVTVSTEPTANTHAATKQYVDKQRFNYQTGTLYTVQASDCGVIISCFNSSPITVTIPSGLGAEFNFAVLQAGTGQVTFAASGTTLLNVSSHTKTLGQYAVVSFVSNATDTFIFSGATAA